MSAKLARAIRRRCQRNSQDRNGMGISELFLAPAEDAAAILAVADLRLKQYLLGYTPAPVMVRSKSKRR
ncbi:MAG TPA: hypothetical protein PKN33_02575 [Phycisphaerae bacterium]|nr:hypothetical protein [Phycisphaerales bacterium]HNO76919.1 hypothetical protein [Phycisphaerae bacterium]